MIFFTGSCALINIVVSLTFTTYRYSAKQLSSKRIPVTVMAIPFLIFTALFHFSSFSQTPVTITHTTEQQLESITENNQDVEPEDDAYLQQLQQFSKDPVNLNYADETTLQELHLLTPLQIQQFILYRKLLGNFISVYELQAIPQWTPALLRKIRPYITVSSNAVLLNSFRDRLHNGEHSVLLRVSQVPERSKGYLVKDTLVTNFYAGSPQKILVRYKYVFKNLLQFGILAEKDAGEQFFGGRQKQGFDFYSAHLFLQHSGIIRTLALGDFTVNLGQGLTQWQSLAFKKSAEVMSVKREGTILRPYNSGGELNFHRGVGITVSKRQWQATVFVSYKKIDGNFVTDTLHQQEDFISSLQSSGYHRTAAEAADKGIQRQLAYGGNFSYQYKRLHLGINGISYKFKLPLVKPADLYNKYALNGRSFGNYSFDYNYTYRNLHLFGEAAFTANFDKAFVQGLLVSVSAFADMALVYRSISKTYQSLYTNAFTEATYPNNEKGLYTGITIRPDVFWRIDAYADLYKFPWLKYRVNAPSAGKDYLVQITYKPTKHLEIYSRYRAEFKPININPDTQVLASVVALPRQEWRTQVDYAINPSLTFRGRVDVVWIDKKGTEAGQGFLAAVDLLFDPPLKPYSGNLRLQYFDSDSYNSRLYAYENDVLYNFSIPVFYDKGYRYYINTNYDVNKKLTIWVKWAQTIYTAKTYIGSGLDQITGNHKSEIKLQVRYKF